MSGSIGRLAVIGVGLIGGSLARALQAAGKVDQIVGCGRGKANLDESGGAGRHRPINARYRRGSTRCRCRVSVGAAGGDARSIRGHARQPTGDGVDHRRQQRQGSVVADCRAVAPELLARFVPGHPIAGTENNGVAASFAELYQNRRVILTPLAENDAASVACARDVAGLRRRSHRDAGTAPRRRLLAATSHLPHMLAFGLVDMLARLKENDEVFRYAAGGFRDFTRIASSNPVMWRDICIANRQALGPCWPPSPTDE